jgi:hypothetical protein
MTRLSRELATLEAMVLLYCRRHHGARPPCGACQDLLAYASQRIRRCPHLPAKPACSHCPVHCFKPERREEIRGVMRFAGPRMLLRHPWLALLHLWDARRRPPDPRG